MVRQLAAPEEIARFRPAIVRAVETFSTETRSLEDRDTYGKAFLQVTNLWRRDEEVRQFVLNQKFARVAAALLGVERVRLYHDQALFKEPKGGFTPWHQDQYYWPLDTDKTITMWMPLVDITPEMGMLTFASGSHSVGAIRSLKISDESESVFSDYVDEMCLPVVRADSMVAGDATFHRGWTIHAAGRNDSADTLREVMTVIYFADGARVAKPENDNQIADLEAFLGGRVAGEVADSELNPVI